MPFPSPNPSFGPRPFKPRYSFRVDIIVYVRFVQHFLIQSFRSDPPYLFLYIKPLFPINKQFSIDSFLDWEGLQCDFSSMQTYPPHAVTFSPSGPTHKHQTCLLVIPNRLPFKFSCCGTLSPVASREVDPASAL